MQAHYPLLTQSFSNPQTQQDGPSNKEGAGGANIHEHGGKKGNGTNNQGGKGKNSQKGRGVISNEEAGIKNQEGGEPNDQQRAGTSTMLVPDDTMDVTNSNESVWDTVKNLNIKFTKEINAINDRMDKFELALLQVQEDVKELLDR